MLIYVVYDSESHLQTLFLPSESYVVGCSEDRTRSSFPRAAAGSNAEAEDGVPAKQNIQNKHSICTLNWQEGYNKIII